jgi:SAM-dependent methyltransferase
MHPSVYDWVAAKVAEHNLTAADTLEVGSYNVNGSVRDLFTGPYIGVDMRPGPGVDHVATADRLPFDDDMFEVVVSTEMLEHDPTFWLSIPEMARVLRPGGHLLLTARGNGFPPHEYPSDYWRFEPEAFRLLFALAGLATLEVTADYPANPGVFGLATK